MRDWRLWLGILSLPFWVACQDKHQSPPAPPEPTVQAVQVEMRDWPIVKSYIGITKSIAAVGIRARVQGFLQSMYFKEGSLVQKDQLLFVIDPKPFQASLDLANANLQNALANAEYQKAELKRKADLVKKSFVSQEEYDQQKARYDEAVAQVAVNRAQVETAEINLGYCRMYSPITGLIGERQVDIGNLVGGSAETLLVTVVKLDPIYVQFSPSVDDFGEILKYYSVDHPFQVSAVIPDYPNIQFSGQVDFINNTANSSTGTVLMRALVKNEKRILHPGIYVNVQLVLSSKSKAIVLPATALQESQGRNYVYKIDQTGKIIQQNVLLDSQTSSLIVVKSGVAVGDIVMIGGQQKVMPGEKVKYQLVER